MEPVPSTRSWRSSPRRPAGGDDALAVSPPAIKSMVNEAGYSSVAGGEPSEAEVAPIREQLPIVPAADATVLANRELFGWLANRAMLRGMQKIFEWNPGPSAARHPARWLGRVRIPVAGQVAPSGSG